MIRQASLPLAELAWEFGRLGCFDTRFWLVSDTSQSRTRESLEYFNSSDFALTIERKSYFEYDYYNIE